MTKIQFLKTIDSVVGRVLVHILSHVPRGRTHWVTELRKVLFIRPGGIGDAVLLLPAIKTLRQRIPDVTVDVLCERRNAGVLGLSPDISGVYLYDSGGGLVRCLRNKYDVVFDTEQWHRLSAVVALLTGAQERVGFETNERSRLFTKKVPYSHDDYEAESFLRLAGTYAGGNSEFNPEEAFIESQESLLPEGMSGYGAFVSLFPGASVPERHWGGERFGHVAQHLQRKGYGVVIVGSRLDGQEAAVIGQGAPGCIDLTGRTTLRDVAAVLKASRLLITADSGLMHLAVALGTPTLSLFGAGIQKKWGPKGKTHMILNKNLPCSPCTRFGYTPACPRGVECLALISVGEVVSAAEMVLGVKA